MKKLIAIISGVSLAVLIGGVSLAEDQEDVEEAISTEAETKQMCPKHDKMMEEVMTEDEALVASAPDVATEVKADTESIEVTSEDTLETKQSEDTEVTQAADVTQPEEKEATEEAVKKHKCKK